MHKPQIIFFDIDGTLIDMEKKQVTPLMLDTLHRLQANGIRLAIATGTVYQIMMGGRKAAATHLCGSCAGDGIYHFCAENGLI